MRKICPYSMAGEPTECYRNDCMAWNDEECTIFESQPLSLYFISKNLKKIADDMYKIKDEMKWNR